MALVCLIYASRANCSFSAAELAQVTRLSAERNTFRDISGTLLYCDGIFLQMLEGQEGVVREVFEKISKDSRHHDIQEVCCTPIENRSFGGWGMSFLHNEDTDAVNQRKLRKIFNRLGSAAGSRPMGNAAQILIQNLKSAIERQSVSAGLQRAA